MNSSDRAVLLALYKVTGGKLKSLRAALVAFIVAMSVGVVAAQDHTVVVREATTVEKIVQQELQSIQFVKQIATYNGVAVSTILPAGTRFQIPKPYFAHRNFGSVAFVKGDVTHTQKQLVVNPPLKGARVFNGDILTTGEDGFVSLTFGSGASVNLQPDTRMSIVNINCVDPADECVIALNAEKGEVQSEVTPRSADQPAVKFSVETPFLSAAVRGTAFYVDADQNVNRLGVTRGLVSAASNGAENEVPRGKGLLALRGAAPSIVDLLPPPEPNEVAEPNAELLFSSEDIFSWKVLDGAEKYRISISRNASGLEPVIVQELTDNSFAPAMDATDAYYLAIAGIDEQGFVGLALNTRLNYVSIEDTASPELSIRREAGVSQVSAIGYDGAIELQLSHSIDGAIVNRRVIESLSGEISLDLDPSIDWVFRARKVLGETAVSRYGNSYLLKATQ